MKCHLTELEPPPIHEAHLSFSTRQWDGTARRGWRLYATGKQSLKQWADCAESLSTTTSWSETEERWQSPASLQRTCGSKVWRVTLQHTHTYIRMYIYIHTYIYIYINQKHIDTHIPMLYSSSGGLAALWDLEWRSSRSRADASVQFHSVCAWHQEKPACW